MFGNFPLSGKIVAITGGASGIGFALSKLALEAQASVIIADLKHSEESKKLLTESNRARFLHCDVGNWRKLEGIVSFSKQEFSVVPDVYVANAGIGDTEFWADKKDDSYEVLNINLAHPIKLTRIAIRALSTAEKKGVVVVTSSIAGCHGHFSTPLYTASKHGTIGFIKSMAQAEAMLGVKVVGICPCLVETPLITSILDKLHGDKLKRPQYLSTTEVAMRMKDLIEQGDYQGGIALEVSKPGHAAVVANGSNSELEVSLPSDPGYIKSLL